MVVVPPVDGLGTIGAWVTGGAATLALQELGQLERVDSWLQQY